MLATLALLAALASPSGAIRWEPFSQEIFQRARAEHRYLLLDLEAVWCHWCHVMDEKTYRDPAVVRLIGQHYLAVQVDQDASPELSDRYQQWGWPATIVFAPDGTEIVKRRGYLPPAQMARLLQAIVDDPSPGPSVVAEAEPVPSGAHLGSAARRQVEERLRDLYDARHGGWGSVHRLLEADLIELAVSRAQAGDAEEGDRARQTLEAAVRILDPVWGGLYQYSDALDWSSPHFEKLASVQAQGLAAWALGYAQWKDPTFLEAAQGIHRYLDRFLKSPEGTFYVSQDADLSAAVTGHSYYAWSDRVRAAHGFPRVDRHVYARENGWIIAALCKLADATGDASALAEAEQAARWVLEHRGEKDGSFRHDGSGGSATFGDSLAMGQAFFALYQSTADPSWLAHAQATLDAIVTRFADGKGLGFTSAAPVPGAQGVFARAVRPVDENAQLARLANLLFHATGQTGDQEAAEHALRYLAALPPAALGPAALLADAESAREPLRVTLLGSKRDPAARALFAAARALPAPFRLLEWLDRAEAPLPHPMPPFPTLSRPALFVCRQNSCSLPIYAGEKLAQAAGG